MRTPSVEGIVSADELEATGEAIAALQLPSGMIEWFPGGHADPWNHVEAAMALATVGRNNEAEAAYRWLADVQHPDGGWHNYYLADGVEDPKVDANCVAYLATGVWHHYLATKDHAFVESMFPVIDRAIDYVLDLQTIRGEVIWARSAQGMPWSYALLTGSASIGHSLGCALLLADVLDHDRPRWDEGRDRLLTTVREVPEAFEPKDRWAMDWYYPVLTGAVRGPAAIERIDARWDEFVMADKGVRCVSDEPWVTAAETCECAMALLAIGDRRRAIDLFRWACRHRNTDGGYFTGLVYPDAVQFPHAECSSYTSAAVILAADALDGSNPTSNLFTVHG